MPAKELMTTPILRILMLGDVVGKTGRDLFARLIGPLKAEYAIDAVIINGDNSADNGLGITPEVAEFFKSHGVSMITTGDHIWDQKNSIPYIKDTAHAYVLRPANLPDQCPGRGVGFFTCKGYTVGVMSLLGRVFMTPLSNCPFQKAKVLLREAAVLTPIMLVDFHAEATAEKMGLAYLLEGRVTAVVGTHTHVQTNDARILPGGTAYMSDLGMSGSQHSIGGFKYDACMQEFTTTIPGDIVVADTPPYVLCGAIITIDPVTGKALAIERISASEDASRVVKTSVDCVTLAKKIEVEFSATLVEFSEGTK